MGEKTTTASKLTELIGGIEFAMLTTVEADGSLRSRPMAVQPSDAGNELWFFTNLDSLKVEEVEHDRHVNVAFAAPAENRFVSVSGFASVFQERGRIDELWHPAYSAWLPLGKDDPHLALLRVWVAHAEYWDAASSRMVQLVGFPKPSLIGRTVRPGDSRQLSFDEDAGRTSAYAHDRGGSKADPMTHILLPLDETPD